MINNKEVGKITAVFEILNKQNSKPKSELYYKNPYTLLVAVVLSAQSTDKGVNKVTKKLFLKIDNPEKMVNFGLSKLTKAISSIGLYNNKAKNIIELSKKLISHHNGLVPKDYNSLIALNGVGDKTAKVVLNIVFGQPYIAVDTHIKRVSNRIGLTSSKDVKKISKILENIIPMSYKLYAHHWLILHGRYICKARTPSCFECPITNLCDYYVNKASADNN